VIVSDIKRVELLSRLLARTIAKGDPMIAASIDANDGKVCASMIQLPELMISMTARDISRARISNLDVPLGFINHRFANNERSWQREVVLRTSRSGYRGYTSGDGSERLVGGFSSFGKADVIAS